MSNPVYCVSVARSQVPIRAERSQATFLKDMLHCLVWVTAWAFACGYISPLVEVACGLADLGSRSVQFDPILPWEVCTTGQFFSWSLNGVVVMVVPFDPFVNSVLC